MKSIFCKLSLLFRTQISIPGKTILILLLSLFISSFGYSQTGWYSVTDSVGRLYLSSVQFTSENTGYSCGSYGNTCTGVFLKTTNAGLNWQRTEYSTRTIDEVYFLNSLTGYYIGWTFLTGYYSGYIYKTTDGAVSWARKDSIQAGNFFKIKFYDVNTGMVAGKYGGAYLTTNGGVNWNAVHSNNSWMEPSGIWCLDANTWFIGDGSRLNKTTNQGQNWNLIDSIYGGPIYFLNSVTGFAASSYGNIYKTTNSGNNWLKICNGGIEVFAPFALTFTSTNTGYMSAYNSNKVYKTINGGYNWIALSVNQNFWGGYSLSFINDNTGYVSSTSGRIYKTTNGGTVFVSNISSEVPEKYSLGQNYPNPYNPISNFKSLLSSC